MKSCLLFLLVVIGLTCINGQPSIDDDNFNATKGVPRSRRQATPVSLLENESTLSSAQQSTVEPRSKRQAKPDDDDDDIDDDDEDNVTTPKPRSKRFATPAFLFSESLLEIEGKHKNDKIQTSSEERVVHIPHSDSDAVDTVSYNMNKLSGISSDFNQLTQDKKKKERPVKSYNKEKVKKVEKDKDEEEEEDDEKDDQKDKKKYRKKSEELSTEKPSEYKPSNLNFTSWNA